MKIDVYAFGSALIDIQAEVPDSLFAELAIDKGNMYLTERSRQEAVLRKLTGNDTLDLEQLGDTLQTAAGGSAANTVYGIAQLGGTAGLCGKVARDGFGARYIRHMQDSGVIFSGQQVPGMTGSCIVLISSDAQRTMLTNLGVSSELALTDIQEDHLCRSAYLYLEGYLFDSALATETMLKAVSIAKKAGARIALTASDAFCVERHKDIMLRLLRQDVDLLFANAQEAQALSDTGSPDEALRALAGQGPNVALTDGGNGSLLHFDGTLERIAPAVAAPRDTTGAGDSYAAGLLFGITHGYSLAASGRIASVFAARVVSQLGPRFSGDIRSELAEQGLTGEEP